MSQTLILELSDEIYTTIQLQAEAAGTSLAHWLAKTLEQQYSPTRTRPREILMKHLAGTRFFATEAEILAAFPHLSRLSLGSDALRNLICWCWRSDESGSLVLGAATPSFAQGGVFNPLVCVPNRGGWFGCGHWRLLGADPDEADSDGYEAGALIAFYRPAIPASGLSQAYWVQQGNSHGRIDYRPAIPASDLSQLTEDDDWELLGAMVFTKAERDRLLYAVEQQCEQHCVSARKAGPKQ